MKTMGKIFIAGLMLFASSAGYGQAKVNLTGTQTAIPSQSPVRRVEIVARDFLVNGDAYVLWEKQNKPFSKFRLQALPLSYGCLSLGVAEQWITTGTPYDEFGGVSRLSGKIDGMMCKLDVRYFPKTKTVDCYGFVSSDHFLGDVLGAYNSRSKTLMVRPGIDYKLSPNVSVGVESKISGPIDDVRMDYCGIRMKISP